MSVETINDNCVDMGRINFLNTMVTQAEGVAIVEQGAWGDHLTKELGHEAVEDIVAVEG